MLASLTCDGLESSSDIFRQESTNWRQKYRLLIIHFRSFPFLKHIFFIQRHGSIFPHKSPGNCILPVNSPHAIWHDTAMLANCKARFFTYYLLRWYYFKLLAKALLPLAFCVKLDNLSRKLAREKKKTWRPCVRVDSWLFHVACTYYIYIPARLAFINCSLPLFSAARVNNLGRQPLS